MKLFFRAVFAFSILLLACKEKIPTKTIKGDSAPASHLLLLAPESGARYIYDILSENKTTYEIGDVKKESGNTIQMNVSYETGNDSSNNYLFNITYNTFKAEIKAENQMKKLDASNTLRKVSNGVVFLDVNGMVLARDEKVSVQGVNAKVDLEGTQEGEVQVEEKTGMLLKAIKIKSKRLNRCHGSKNTIHFSNKE